MNVNLYINRKTEQFLMETALQGESLAQSATRHLRELAAEHMVSPMTKFDLRSGK